MWRQGSPYQPYNDDLRCIFVHVPKVAGLSIVAALFGLANSDPRQPGHRAAWEYRWYDSKRFRQYFKFGFVRNPYDRFLSAFRFLQRGGLNDSDRRYMEEYISGHRAVDDFVSRLQKDTSFRRRALVYPHFRLQADYLCGGGGNVLLDFVGRYECLRGDFVIVRDRLGTGGNLPWVNQSNPSFRDDLGSAHRRFLWKIYKRDFQTFGYPR
jgi:hypothetical protein